VTKNWFWLRYERFEFTRLEGKYSIKLIWFLETREMLKGHKILDKEKALGPKEETASSSKKKKKRYIWTYVLKPKRDH